MTIPVDPSEPGIPDPGAGITRTVPIPPAVAREMEVCIAIDQLRLALEAARLAVEAARAAPSKLPPESSSLDLHMRWSAATLLLSTAFERVEQQGMATYKAIRSMLALE